MWGKDQYARGAYSYVAVGSNGDDYDALKESINKTLYFAGEHCSRSNPTTCAGAMMSGLMCRRDCTRSWALAIRYNYRRIFEASHGGSKAMPGSQV